MVNKILECVPNFSEGRDMSVIKQITDVIEAVDGVKLLNVDPGRDTNRTVVTFAGTPDEVCEAAFLAVKKAAELIDMSKHRGTHPRMGATDVCPLVPVTGITMEETVILARKLAGRIGNELGIPVYCYENAAFAENRRDLANCRAGEYEGLKKKLADPAWKPDYGPALFNPRSGATAVGARDFLIAFNVNLNTTSVRRANAIAYDIREKGRPMREGNSLTGKILKDKEGNSLMIPGTLKHVKAIGWYIEEYGFAQVSMNLTDISKTPLHTAFDEVCRKAEARGVRVTGSELVGLVPLRVMLEAGKYYLEKQQRSTGVPDEELIRIAVRSLGLNDIRPFNPEERIIEYILGRFDMNKKLKDLSLVQYLNKTASESPAPGGGSASAYIGALGTALGTMVANLSAHKRGWDDKWKEFSDWACRGKEIQNRLLELVDEDTEAYNKIIEARSLPSETEALKQEKERKIQEAAQQAVIVPFKVMETAFSAFGLIREMIEKGLPGSVTDAGVGALALLACIKGAFLNIKINLSVLRNEKFMKDILLKACDIESKAMMEEEAVMKLVNSKICPEKK